MKNGFLTLVFGVIVSSRIGLAAEIPNFNIRTCSSDKKECYEIRAQSVGTEEGHSIYTFDEAEFRILSKTHSGYKLDQVVRATRGGTLDLSRGIVSLNDDRTTFEQNLRSGRRSRN